MYFVAGGGTDLLSPGVGSIVVATERFQVPEYEKTAFDVYPRRSVRKPFDFTIYKLVQIGSDSAAEFAGYRRHGRSASRRLLSKGEARWRRSDIPMEPGHLISAHESPVAEP